MSGNEAHHACVRTARQPGALILATVLDDKGGLADSLHFEDSALKIERKPVAQDVEAHQREGCVRRPSCRHHGQLRAEDLSVRHLDPPRARTSQPQARSTLG